MKKNLTRLIILFLLIFLVRIVFAVYKDIVINKLLNFTISPEQIGEVKTIQGPNNNLEYSFNFMSTEDYLGALYIPHFPDDMTFEQLSISIKQVGEQKWYHENVYDNYYVKNLDNNVFGFPVIVNSKAEVFQVTLNFTEADNYSYDSSFETNLNETLKVKHVFSKETVLKNPKLLFHILKYRILDTTNNLNKIEISITSLFISILILATSQSNILMNFGLDGVKKYLLVQKLVAEILFAVLLTIFTFIIFSTLFQKYPYAEILGGYVWIVMAIAVFVSGCIYFVKNYFPSVNKYIEKISGVAFTKNAKTFMIFVAIMVVLISGLKQSYYLGGDDSRLFYLYPEEFLTNFAVKIVSDTSMSSIVTVAPPVITPFVILMVILKKIIGPLNLQAIMYTANILGGIAFFYLFVDSINPIKNKYSKIINLITSFLYVYSIFNFYTLFNSRLTAIYLISLFPLFAYLFLKAITREQIIYVILIAFLGSLFCVFTLASPWSFASGITVLPLIFWIAKDKKYLLTKYVLVFSLLVIVLNFHWLVYLPFTPSFTRDKGENKPSILSTEFRKENERGIAAVASENSVFFPLLNAYPVAIQKNFNWAFYNIYKNINSKTLPLNLIYIAVILMASIIVSQNNKKESNITKMYSVVMGCFLIAVYFFTVNVTEFGVKIFIWLNNMVPGFVMFRNMYDKFAYAISLNLGILLSLSLSIVSSKIKNDNLTKVLLFFILSIGLLNAMPFLTGKYTNSPIWTTQNSYDSITKLNDDFIDLTEVIKSNNNPDKYLVLPLTTGNAFPISDKFKPNHYYNGVSPLLALTGKNDFSGLLSFGQLSPVVYSNLKDKNFFKIGKILQKLNIKYIIVNHTVNEELQNSYVYSDGLYNLQSDEMIRGLLGNKISDFGTSYSLYSINEQFDSNKIFLSESSENPEPESGNIAYEKLDSHLYDIGLPERENDSGVLIFLDPYMSGWELRDTYGNKINATHFLALGYANGWKLPAGTPKNIKLYYQPYDYFWISNYVSIVGYVFCLIIIIYSIIRKKYAIHK